MLSKPSINYLYNWHSIVNFSQGYCPLSLAISLHIYLMISELSLYIYVTYLWSTLALRLLNQSFSITFLAVYLPTSMLIDIAIKHLRQYFHSKEYYNNNQFPISKIPRQLHQCLTHLISFSKFEKFENPNHSILLADRYFSKASHLTKNQSPNTIIDFGTYNILLLYVETMQDFALRQ